MAIPDARTLSPSAAAMRSFVIAWMCCTVFYFLEYAIRAEPAAMIPELAHHFGVTVLGVSKIVGIYYYTYSTASLVAGVFLDHFGAKWVIPAGALILSSGCVLFVIPSPVAGDVGRLMQGAGSAFAFTGAVYLAAHGLSANRLATAIGVTQMLGMLGGSAGPLLAASLLNGMASASGVWWISGLAVLTVTILLNVVTPNEMRPDSVRWTLATILSPYKIVFLNPQSYLCGLTAGLLFAPTTVFDLVWAVRFLQQDASLAYRDAIFTASMVPFGWVIGAPLLGWLADQLGRRKPALVVGILIMLSCLLQLALAPQVLPSWLTLLLFGVGSGAAMIAFTIMKEVNPDRVKGSATGAMNFLTFSVTALIGPIFAFRFGKTLGVADVAEHLRGSYLFWCFLTACALIVALLLRETGCRRRQVASMSVDVARAE